MRKVNLAVLTANTFVYRIWTTIENWLFLWLIGWLFGLYSAGTSLLVSIGWNIVNMGSYWLWHYYFLRWFPINKTGVTYWYTGPPGAGKTYAAEKKQKELEALGRTVVHLDGNVVRDGLNKDLGFSPEDRDRNIRRMGHLCKILNNQGVDVVASFVSPYRDRRLWLRNTIKNFRLIYVATADHICRKRRKNLYATVDVGPYESPSPVERDEIIIGA